MSEATPVPVMVEARGMTRRFGSVAAVEGLSLSVPAGEIFGFIGPNGAGKTTTIRILATLDLPTEGSARIAGHDVVDEPEAVRDLMGYMPDAFGVYDGITVAEYLEFFAAAYNIHGQQRRKVVNDVLELTDLTFKATAEVNSLSRGMQQRLSIARVLLHDPKVLLMDEPASGLDPRARIEIRELLKELKRMGKTILISSHILHELSELCNTVGIIERGKLLFAGTVREALIRAKVGHIIHIGVVDRIAQAAELLAKVPGVKRVALIDGETNVLTSGASNGQAKPARGAAPVNRQLLHITFDETGGHNYTDLPNVLVNHGFRLTKFAEEAVNLETAFMRLTKGMVQ